MSLHLLTRSIYLQLAKAKFQAQTRSSIQEHEILQEIFFVVVHLNDLGLTISIYC